MKGLFQTTRRPTEQNPVMLLLVLYLAQFSAVTARKIREDNKMMVNSRNIHREIINRDYVRSIVPARSDGQHRVELKFSLFSLDEVKSASTIFVYSILLYTHSHTHTLSLSLSFALSLSVSLSSLWMR